MSLHIITRFFLLLTLLFTFTFFGGGGITIKILRYVPPGSGASGAGATAKGAAGYFSGLRAQKDSEASTARAAESLPSRAEMSATVKAAARAAAARLAADKKPSARGGDGGGGGGEGGTKIERDIFAKRPSRGQALGVASGGYDVYPETGDFETYDSDEVGLLGEVFRLLPVRTDRLFSVNIRRERERNRGAAVDKCLPFGEARCFRAGQAIKLRLSDGQNSPSIESRQ